MSEKNILDEKTMSEIKNVSEDIYRRGKSRKENNLERDTKKYQKEIIREQKTHLEKLQDELDRALKNAKSKTNPDMQHIEKLQSEFVKQKKRM